MDQSRPRSSTRISDHSSINKEEVERNSGFGSGRTGVKPITSGVVGRSSSTKSTVGKLRSASNLCAAKTACRLLKAPEGFSQFSSRMLQLYKQYGIEWPLVTVEYRQLNVSTKALVGSAGVPTVGNVLVQAAKDLFSRGGQTADLHILKDISGVLKPGTLTLLLGSPGSGKSTLLKLLSGRLNSKQLQVSGSVLYNGKDFSQFVVQRTAAYVDQHDQHLPVLTVGETLDFAHACAGAGMPDFITKTELQDIYVRSQSQHHPTHQGLSNSDDAAAVISDEPGTSANRKAAEDGEICIKSSCSSTAIRSRRVADAVMGSDGFVHAPEEAAFTQQEFAKMLALNGSTFKLELVLRMLGLMHARNTIMGSALVRGVSGGERKRVTTGEMLVGNQRVLMMDEISTGLDSATLYSIITYLKQSVGALQHTAVVSLLQPPPEVMGLFDDVILLAQGRVVYHGPVQEVQQHFEGLGFTIPPRMDLPTWLVALTTPAGQWMYSTDSLKQQHSSIRRMAAAASAESPANGTGAVAENPAWRVTQPTAPKAPADAATVAEELAGQRSVSGDFAERPLAELPAGRLPMILSAEQMSAEFWQGSQHGTAMLQELNAGAASEAVADNNRSLVQQQYALKPWRAFKLATQRQWSLFARNRLALIFRAMQVVAIGMLIGSVFANIPADRSGVRVVLGASFITCIFLVFISQPDQSAVMNARPVWYKHRANQFMPAYAETAAMAIVRMLSATCEALVFGSIIYWMVGYTRTADAYLIYLLILICHTQAMSALFRFVGAIAPTPMHAQGFGSLSLLVLILTSGFGIIKPSIPAYWVWAYWISPFAYALRAILVHELTSQRWSYPAPGNGRGLTIGEEGLETYGFFTEGYWVWVGVAYMVFWALLMNVGTCLALKYYSGPERRASVPDEQALLKRRLKAEQRSRQQQQQADLQDMPSVASMNGSSTLNSGSSSIHKSSSSSIVFKSPVVGRYRTDLDPQKDVNCWSSTTPGSARSTVAITAAAAAAAAEPGSRTALSFRPITLVFENINYYVPHPAAARKKSFLPAWLSRTKTIQSKQALTPSSTVDSKRSRHSSVDGLQRTNVSASGVMSAEQTAATVAVEHVTIKLQQPDSGKALHQQQQQQGAAGPTELHLLQNVSGYAKPGQLTALMGGSGAGKTTLLDVLAGRKTVGRVTGSILVNGVPKQQASWARQVGFVEQMDIHTPGATVAEALWFSGRLRLPISVTDEQVRARVDHVLAEVDTTHRAADLVGVPGSTGLPTEARKRLTIAVELVANPAVLFMDEPTSGLDARAAGIVTDAIKRVAASGRTLIVTIHQPSLQIFEAFDRLMLLQRGGKVIYFGPLGVGSPRLIEYLETVPGTAPLLPGYNPATWMLEVTAGAMATLHPANTSVDWAHQYSSSSLYVENQATAQALVKSLQHDTSAAEIAAIARQNSSDTTSSSSSTGMYAQPFSRQLLECTRRLTLAYWRSPSYNSLRLALTVACAAIYGTLYKGVGHINGTATIGDVQNAIGILFQGSSFLGNINWQTGMPVFRTERAVFYRERAALMYDPLAIGIATILAEIPYLVAQALLFTPIVYWLVDFRHSAEAFVFYLLVCAVNLTVYTSLAMFLVAATPTAEVAHILQGSMNFFMQIFNGFTITKSAIPAGWIWANMIVPTKWVIFSLASSQFGANTTPLSGPGLPANTTVASYLAAVYGYNYSFRWYSLLIVCSYVVALMGVSVLLMRHVSFLKR